ncbi:MAG: hypothetical protein M3133_10885, partial [Actinomycetota bacterium]|nr:hypothetical protein [Actinomycetota bacterium]
HFTTPAQGPRHLFSRPDLPEASLNREYVPHIAAYAFAVLAAGYEPERSGFSVYRKFERDLLEKRAGQSYETDVEFYDAEGDVFLQIEAKASARQTEALAADILSGNDLGSLRADRAKELEYVLDLTPRYLWIVGPGSVDPPRHVFEVHIAGLEAQLLPIGGLPPPPSGPVALSEAGAAPQVRGRDESGHDDRVRDRQEPGDLRLRRDRQP